MWLSKRAESMFDQLNANHLPKQPPERIKNNN